MSCTLRGIFVDSHLAPAPRRMARQRMLPALLTLFALVGRDHALRVPVITMSASPPSFFDPSLAARRILSAEAALLGRELVQLGLKQDPRVVLRRSLDLARAINTVGNEVTAGLQPTSPPVLLRRMCEELGATYIKLGQFVASSPTLFPPDYVMEFQKCLDATPPMPWREVRSLIETELGRPLDRVFTSVSQTPLAAASIAQVHAAKLRSGEDVVIKVQKIGVQDSLQADLDLLYGVVRVLELVGLATSELTDVVSTLRDAIFEETDFLKEAQRTTQFREFLDRAGGLADQVTVPKVYPQASSRRVLTLERLYGVPMTDLDVVKQFVPEPELALIVALNTWVLSVLTNEWFHADVHAGNLLVLRDGRIAFIDFGIVGSIPEKTANAMIDFVRAFPSGDTVGIASALAGMGFVDESEVDIPAFSRDLRDVLESVDDITSEGSAGGTIDENQLNKLVASVGKVAAGYGIRFPREFALLLKQVLYFDRFTRLLAPDLDVMNDERITMNRSSPNSSVTYSSPKIGYGFSVENSPSAEERGVDDSDSISEKVVEVEVLP